MDAKYVETSSREKKSCMSMREKCTSRTDKRGKEFDSGLLGATYNKAFDKPGEFTHFCQVYPTMIGKVIVDATEEPDIKYSKSTENATKTTEAANETPSIIANKAIEQQQQNVIDEGAR
jgi:hypothetical protein